MAELIPVLMTQQDVQLESKLKYVIGYVVYVKGSDLMGANEKCMQVKAELC